VKKIPAVMLLVLVLTVSLASAQDVREAARKAEADKKAAEQRAREIEEKILNDRQQLIAEVEKLEARERELQKELAALERKIERDELTSEKLADRWAQRELDFKEISGNVRVVARELEQLLVESPFTALDPQRLDKLSPILQKGYFPGIDDIAVMGRLLFDEIRMSGQVGLIEGTYIGRDGDKRVGKVLTLGKFTGIYAEGGEVGFLRYSAEGRRLFAMSALPPRGIRNNINKYLAGRSDEIYIDISGGAALRQITHKTTFMDQLKAGGPLVWPIGAVALAALIIVISKMFFLNQVRRNTGKYMTRVNKFASEGKWAECEDIVRRHKGEHSPVNHVIEAGLMARNEDRETLESILQESILRELPRLERGISPLAIFGAVAPLLGLLGTVTGMIDTFRVITLYGTGDPKLMSGGISEALVTTEFGLIVAIPIMLLHTWLSRRVDHIVGEMEEKAVSMINIIEKQKRKSGDPCLGIDNLIDEAEKEPVS
jgi:biopolymer transport protein ExbB